MEDVTDYNSPEERAKRHEQRVAMRRAAFVPVRDALARRGIDCPTVNDIENLAPLSDELVEVLLSVVEQVAKIEPVVAEMMIRPLPLAANKFDGSLLEKMLMRESATPLEFALANTLLLAKPSNVSADAMKRAKRIVLKK
jgi:hypothetical protein